jgi:hypothetical protein
MLRNRCCGGRGSRCAGSRQSSGRHCCTHRGSRRPRRVTGAAGDRCRDLQRAYGRPDAVSLAAGMHRAGAGAFLGRASVRHVFVVCSPPPRRTLREYYSIGAIPVTTGIPACTVVVCTRNRPAMLHRCLQGLGELSQPAFQVLVVDNAPEDDAARGVSLSHGARYLLVPDPGLSRARNAGLASCHTEIIVYLDDDAIPSPNWLDALLNCFDDPQIAAVGGRVHWCEVAGAPQHDSVPAAPATAAVRVDRNDASWYEKVNFGGIGCGGNMAFRVSALRDVAGFNERLGLGAGIPVGEDNFAFFTLVRAGYRAAYAPDAVVLHPLPPPGVEFAARRRRDLAAAVAYACYFLVEQAGVRTMTASYLLRSLLEEPRGWATQPLARRHSRIGAVATVAAVCRGVTWYLRDRVKRVVSSIAGRVGGVVRAAERSRLASWLVSNDR